jgi:glutamine amidotransferase
MCRALIYLGQPVLLDDLLFQPDSALVNQSYRPKMLHMLNLAGFGMMAWDGDSHAPGDPHRYHSVALPIFDRNLKSLATKVRADCVIAHVRGVAYSTKVHVSDQNTHPFRFDGCAVSLAHNGDIYRIADIRPALSAHIKPEFLQQIAGTTDSEWIYALLVSQLADPYREPEGDELPDAVEKVVAILAEARRKAGIDISSSCNLFIATGSQILGLRHCFDFGRYRTGSPDQVHEANLSFLSMWFTLGRDFGPHEGEWQMTGSEAGADSVLIASEPLSTNTATWFEVPEYGMVHAKMERGKPAIKLRALSL